MTIRCQPGGMDDDRAAALERLREIARRAAAKAEARLPVPPANAKPTPRHWSEGAKSEDGGA